MIALQRVCSVNVKLKQLVCLSLLELEEIVDTRYFNRYSKTQIEKLAYLIKKLCQEYNIHPKNVLGHSDISPSRKTDPGPRFPWKWLYENHGIGMWYDDEDYYYFETNTPLHPTEYKICRDVLQLLLFV